jgi:hypothetical protein
MEERVSVPRERFLAETYNSHLAHSNFELASSQEKRINIQQRNFAIQKLWMVSQE